MRNAGLDEAQAGIKIPGRNINNLRHADDTMYGYESWTMKKAEHQRIDAFECVVEEDSWESLGLQGDTTSPS